MVWDLIPTPTLTSFRILKNFPYFSERLSFIVCTMDIIIIINSKDSRENSVKEHIQMRPMPDILEGSDTCQKEWMTIHSWEERNSGICKPMKQIFQSFLLWFHSILTFKRCRAGDVRDTEGRKGRWNKVRSLKVIILFSSTHLSGRP